MSDYDNLVEKVAQTLTEFLNGDKSNGWSLDEIDAESVRIILSAVGYADLLGERDALAATVARVETLADGWNEAPPRLADLATTRSADGDDSLTRALAIGRAYATALRAALSEPTEGDVSRDH